MSDLTKREQVELSIMQSLIHKNGYTGQDSKKHIAKDAIGYANALLIEWEESPTTEQYLKELKDILEAIVANTSDSTMRLAESGLDIIELLEKETA